MADFRFQPTPNEHAVKVTAPAPFLQGTKTVRSLAEAQTPLEKELVGIEGVVQCFFLNDFVTINKDTSADWDDLRPQVESVLKKHFQAAR